MTIQEIEQLYGRSPQANTFLSLLEEKSVRSVFLQGLLGSSVPMFFAPLQEKMGRTVLFVLNDADEAGYFYHDLTQMMGQENAFFFPSSYRRAIKYGQRDAASEILRTEVLARLSSESSSASGGIYIVSYPAALAEMVVGKQQLDDRILRLQVGQQVSLTDVVHTLRDFELVETDYVYEPGQFAIGYKCVTYREDFFKGHFPEKPVMPGVLILEALAQAGAVAILSVPENKGKIAFFGGVNKCRFRGMVFPGDVLKLETRIIKQKGPVGVGEAVASVNGKTVVTAELTFMVGE